MFKTIYTSPWLSIATDAEAKAGSLKLNGEIGGLDWSGSTYREMVARRADQFQKDLEALAALDVDELTIEISSMGGSFRHALAMHDYLAQFPGHVTTRVVGMTASAATIIAQAGNTREISANAMYLIHRASLMPYGNAFALREATKAVEEMDQRMAEIYAKRSGASVEDVFAIMDEDTGKGRWLSAARAVELGLCDATFEPMDAAACAFPDGVDFVALGLPEPPPPEQTPQPVAHAQIAPPPTPTTAKGSQSMLTAAELTTIKGLFGAEAACSAMTEELSFQDAMAKGAEAQAKALTDARAQIETLTTERDEAKAELATAKTKLDAHAKGLTDPLDTHNPENPGEAEANAEAAKKEAEAKADNEKRQAANDFLANRMK
jgi:ATP-dependent protease ClpP protease subunit